MRYHRFFPLCNYVATRLNSALVPGEIVWETSEGGRCCCGHWLIRPTYKLGNLERRPAAGLAVQLISGTQLKKWGNQKEKMFLSTYLIAYSFLFLLRRCDDSDKCGAAQVSQSVEHGERRIGDERDRRRPERLPRRRRHWRPLFGDVQRGQPLVDGWSDAANGGQRRPGDHANVLRYCEKPFSLLVYFHSTKFTYYLIRLQTSRLGDQSGQQHGRPAQSLVRLVPRIGWYVLSCPFIQFSLL